jgi:hypothetical protein
MFTDEQSKKEQTHAHQEIHAPRAEGQCSHVKSDGSYCRANARRASAYCFVHDPDSAEEVEAARIRGGKERSRKAAVLPADTANMPLTSAADVTALLAETINQVRRGELDPHVSNAVGYLANMLLKAQEQHEFERRMMRVESIVKSTWAKWKGAVDPTIAPESFEFVNPKSGGEA